MEPRNMAIGGVFANSKRLVVPIYQRTYEWTPERQIETLMDYIEAKAEARLANEPARFLHYMGALLLIPRSGFVFGRIPVFDIVDGQQRITTFQLALAALRDLANERGEQSIADQIRHVLFNLDEASMQDKKAERFKLEPTRLDRPIFRDLMTKSLADLQEAYERLAQSRDGHGIAEGHRRARSFSQGPSGSFPNVLHGAGSGAFDRAALSSL